MPDAGQTLEPTRIWSAETVDDTRMKTRREERDGQKGGDGAAHENPRFSHSFLCRADGRPRKEDFNREPPENVECLEAIWEHDR